MARRRFFVPQIRNQQAELHGDDARHLTQVLRVEAGHIYEISDNAHAYLAEVETARKQHVIFKVVDRIADAPPQPDITLLIALIKFERLETVIEKATELGVTRIRIIETIRSERGLEKAAGKRIDRWRRIALEAAQQSRRTHLPVIDEPVRLKDALQHASARRLLLDEAEGLPLLQAVPALGPKDDAALLVGPEGGWTPDERTAAAQAGWTPVTLGPLILRAETAAIAALAILAARAAEA